MCAVAFASLACSGKDFEPSQGTGGTTSDAGLGGAAGSSSGGASASGGSSGIGGAAGAGGSGGIAGSGGAEPVLERVTVQDEFGEPVKDYDVITNFPDGSLFATGKTDATGSVMIDVPEGGSASAVGSVSVVGSSGTIHTYRDVFTVASVAQGATVHTLGPSGKGPVANSAMGDINLNVPDGFPVGTTSVVINLPCNVSAVSPASPLVIKGYVGCPSETQYDVVLLAKDPTGKLLGHAVVSGQTFSPGQAATHLMKFTTGVDQLLVTVDGFAAGSAQVYATLTGFRPGQPNMPIESSASGTAAPAFNTTLELPSGGVLSKLFYSQEVTWTEGAAKLSAESDEPLTSAPSSAHWTFPPALAWATTIAQPDVSQPGQPLFAWGFGDGQLGDCVMLSSAYKRSDNEVLIWYTSLPPAKSGQHRFPELPAQLASARLTAGDQFGAYAVRNLQGTTDKDLCLFGRPKIPTQKVSLTRAALGTGDI